MAKLIFFDKDHTYQVDGETIPSVSEIIRFMSREVYDSCTQWRLDNAADRGSRIHKACENIDRFGSCEVQPDIEPYVRAYIQFLRDKAPSWERIEHAMYHPGMRYAGTLDRCGVIDGRRVIVDIKSNAQIKWPLVTAQLNGYDMLADENGIKADALAVLQLRKDGKYRCREIESNRATFMACLTLHAALRKNTRKKQEVADGTTDDAAE